MSEPITDSPPWWMRIIFGRSPRRTLLRLLILVAAVFFLFRYVVLPIKVSGVSMAPTYMNGKVGMVNQLAYKWQKPQRGDVVAIRVPAEKDLLLKRIVGLPGERVAIRRGEIWIDGKPLDEPYVQIHGNVSRREFALEPDHYFVIGDNRGVSVFLPVPVWNIVGKAFF